MRSKEISFILGEYQHYWEKRNCSLIPWNKKTDWLVGRYVKERVSERRKEKEEVHHVFCDMLRDYNALLLDRATETVMLKFMFRQKSKKLVCS